MTIVNYSIVNIHIIHCILYLPTIQVFNANIQFNKYVPNSFDCISKIFKLKMNENC